MQEQEVVISTESDDLLPSGYRSASPQFSSLPTQVNERSRGENLDTPTLETKFPASVSIADLLKAGKLVKPPKKNKVKLTFEKFDVQNQEWQEVMEQDVVIETQKFSSGAFRDAFRATSKTNGTQKQWVVKTYNPKAVEAIVVKLSSTIDDHARKQVQMHAVARHLAQKFALKAPTEFGACFQYNRCYYTTYNDRPATVEEYVPGNFVKYINNDGTFTYPQVGSSDEYKELFEKAQCLVHYTYNVSQKKLMLLDIQGSKFDLYDPEIATADIMDDEESEIYFCCGNCTSVGIEEFLQGHKCNEYCNMMGFPNLQEE